MKKRVGLATLSTGASIPNASTPRDGDVSMRIGVAMLKRNRLRSALCIGCTLLSSAPSWATTVEPGQGDLSISQGQGFKPIHNSTSARVGDMVMVGPGGAATVTYDDGCKVNVQPGAVTTIAPLSPCASGSNAQTPQDTWNWCQANPDQCTPAQVAFLAAWLGVTVAIVVAILNI